MVFLTSFQIIDNSSKEVKISWSLDPKINILVGQNGSGKTTLLNYIYNTIKGVQQDDFDNDFDFLKKCKKNL